MADDFDRIRVLSMAENDQELAEAIDMLREADGYRLALTATAYARVVESHPDRASQLICRAIRIGMRAMAESMIQQGEDEVQP